MCINAHGIGYITFKVKRNIDNKYNLLKHVFLISNKYSKITFYKC